jgi:SAM-dependent methyltransferase
VTACDKYTLYQLSVQDVDADVRLIQQFYAAMNPGLIDLPRIFREDFCGTGATSCAWAASAPDRVSVGLDLDAEPIIWGMSNNRNKLKDGAARVTFIQTDVRTPPPNVPLADVIAAWNFSWCSFQDRAELRSYFESCKNGLAPGGIFTVDIYGGPEAQVAGEDVTDHGAFAYIWDQELIDPVSGRTICHIHFDLPDGSRMEKAFTYDWRLWTVPEVREVLLEAGFHQVDVWWEGVELDEDGDAVGNGRFERVKTVENEQAWVAFIVGKV